MQGARRHHRLGEPVCGACLAAQRDARRRYHNARTPAPDLPDWARAACAGMDTDLWFPDPHTRAGQAARQQALAVCQGCPIRTACAAWAVEHGERGIWGGLSEEQRRELREAS